MDQFQDSPLLQNRSVSISVLNKFLIQVYGWMAIGLTITFSIGFLLIFLIDRSPAIARFVAISYPFIFLVQIAIVLVLSFLWTRMNTLVSAGLFLFYSATMGIFIGSIMYAYSLNTIILAFGATVLTFLVMSVYGFVTKQDLTRWGNFAIMGLIGLIMATIVNVFMFFISPGFAESFSWILTYIGVGIFLVLIAYDTQKLKNIAAAAEQNGTSLSGYAIQGAFMLYLDFINIFIRLLAIFGKRR